MISLSLNALAHLAGTQLTCLPEPAQSTSSRHPFRTCGVESASPPAWPGDADEVTGAAWRALSEEGAPTLPLGAPAASFPAEPAGGRSVLTRIPQCVSFLHGVLADQVQTQQRPQGAETPLLVVGLKEPVCPSLA